MERVVEGFQAPSPGAAASGIPGMPNLGGGNQNLEQLLNM